MGLSWIIMGLSWDYHGIIMALSWDYHGIIMGFVHHVPDFGHCRATIFGETEKHRTRKTFLSNLRPALYIQYFVAHPDQWFNC